MDGPERIDAAGVRGSNPLPLTTKAHTRERGRGEPGLTRTADVGDGTTGERCRGDRFDVHRFDEDSLTLAEHGRVDEQPELVDQP